MHGKKHILLGWKCQLMWVTQNKKKVRAEASANSISKNRGFLKQCFVVLVNFLKALGFLLRYVDWLK